MDDRCTPTPSSLVEDQQTHADLVRALRLASTGEFSQGFELVDDVLSARPDLPAALATKARMLLADGPLQDLDTALLFAEEALCACLEEDDAGDVTPLLLLVADARSAHGDLLGAVVLLAEAMEHRGAQPEVEGALAQMLAPHLLDEDTPPAS